MTTKQRLYADLGGKLARIGILFQRQAISPEITKTLSKGQLRGFLNDLGIESPIILADSNYALTDWKTWQEIIKYDLTNEFKYISDFNDCDNFSDYFNAFAAMAYGLNTSGRFTVELKDEEDKHIGYHRASCIVCTENGNLAAYAYDPMENMEDQFCKINKGGKIRIKNWFYWANYLSFN
jgi:hypothetical protein